MSIKSEDNVEPLPDKRKLTDRSEDYVILPKEELHIKQKARAPVPKMEEPNYWYPDQMKEGSFK